MVVLFVLKCTKKEKKNIVMNANLHLKVVFIHELVFISTEEFAYFELVLYSVLVFKWFLTFCKLQ